MQTSGETQASAVLAPQRAQDDGSTDVWYYLEAVTQETVGPLTSTELSEHWRRCKVDGFTYVWRPGLTSWRQLTEEEDLKAAIQASAADEVDEASDVRGNGNHQRRLPLEELALTHTYTSEQHVLYVFDTVDGDWKTSDAYEALLAVDQEVERTTVGLPRAAHEVTVEQTSNLTELQVVKSVPEIEVALQNLFEGSGSISSQNDVVSEAEQPLDEERQAKRQKRHDYRARKKLRRQAGMFIKSQQNPNVYVSGLPPDAMVEELEPIFRRAGVLKVDADTGGPKIRIYADATGRCKGDALVTYANAASVQLALEFLRNVEVRPNCSVTVQQADFEEKEDTPRFTKKQLEELACQRQSEKEKVKDRAKYKAARGAQREAVSWNDNVDDGRGRRIVVLRNMFSIEEAETEGAEFYTELASEVREECEKFGVVSKVTPLERHRQGIVCVKFKISGQAEECIRVMDGRYFARRVIRASFYDGLTDLRVIGTLSTACQGEVGKAGSAEVLESKAVELKRTDTTPKEPNEDQSWAAWLDNQSSDSDSETNVRTEF